MRYSGIFEALFDLSKIFNAVFFYHHIFIVAIFINMSHYLLPRLAGMQWTQGIPPAQGQGSAVPLQVKSWMQLEFRKKLA